jgi:hypothetical protein
MSQVDQIAVLERALARFESVVQTLGSAFSPPAFVPLGKSGTEFGFRHAEQDRSARLAAHCKAVNLCSLLGAMAVLLRSGHLHEASESACEVGDAS